MQIVLGPAVLVALRPFETYRQLAARTPTLRAALSGPLAWLLTVACFVSWTTSGALLPSHIVLSPLVWVFAPLGQCLWLFAVARAVGKSPGRHLLAMYYEGHLPWLGLLVLIAGVCLIAPDPLAAYRWSVAFYVLPALVLAATIWCIVLTYALFRAGLDLPRRTSVLCTTAYYLGATATFTGWFLVTGQLLPLWGIM